MTKKYVSTDRSGWTNVKLDGGTVVALPQYLRVEFDTRTANRDHFTILEGVYSGKKASVSAKSASTSWLASPLPTYKSPVFLTFDKSTGVMTTPVGNLKTKTDPTNPISNGSHPIQLPDFPHSLGSSYVSRASKAMTWSDSRKISSWRVGWSVMIVMFFFLREGDVTVVR